MTGGRLGRLRDHLSSTFLMTYGDGVGDIDLNALVDLHRAAGREATMTVARPAARFGRAVIRGTRVTEFSEKPSSDGGDINAGFFVLEPSVLNRIENDEAVFEQDVVPSLARDGELSAYAHSGFWRPMDTLRDRNELERLWSTGDAPWAVWNNSTVPRPVA